MPSVLKIVQQFFPEVNTVKDATHDATIEVTKADEAKSQKLSHKTCAFAVACKRHLALDGIVVSRTRVYAIKGHTAIRYLMEESGTREIVSFDRGGGFAPGTYTIKKPEPSRRIGAISGGNTGKTGKKPLRQQHITSGIRSILQ